MRSSLRRGFRSWILQPPPSGSWTESKTSRTQKRKKLWEFDNPVLTLHTTCHTLTDV